MTQQRQQIAQAQTLSAAPSGLLQRQCACGQHTLAGGECESCRKKRGWLQRQGMGQQRETISHLSSKPNSSKQFNETAQQALDKLHKFEPDRDTLNHWCNTSRGTPLSSTDLQVWSIKLQQPLPTVTTHQDHYADLITMAYNAEAVAVDTNIYFANMGQTKNLLAHEMTHIGQNLLPGPKASVYERETEARELQSQVNSNSPFTLRHAGTPGLPMTHPAIGVLRRAAGWLARRTYNTVSRHVARHGRRIAGRAVHTIFRNPRNIQSMVNRAVREAIAIAQRATRHGADEILEEGGVRIFRQATRTPGKFRIVVEKEFSSAIGTQGERVLRIVLDMSGRIVTAFPADSFARIGIVGMGAVATVNIFGERTAEASELIRAGIEAEREREEDTDWITAIIDFVVAPSVANEGEDLMLDIDRLVAQVTRDVITEIEEAEQMNLGPEQREAIADLVAVAIGSPLEFEDIETEL